MTHTVTHIDFRANTQHVPPHMPPSVQKATSKFLGNRAALVDIIGQDNWQALRQAGHDLRMHAIDNLDLYLEQVEQRVTEAGGHVHWARDAAEAQQIVLDIAREHGVRRVVKSKSMATEEIELNPALQAADISVVETDLGEYIIQLAGVTPSHIIVPAVHLTKEGIADLFTEKLGIDAPPDPKVLTQIAHERLREEFLNADMGISGANFIVAETGTIVVVSNEGNARMCTTLPPLHVAVVGIDKVVPDMQSLAVLLKLLARSATGQKMSCYTSFITGPRREADEGGPQEFHLVLLDNGRTRVLQDEVTRETTLCIRCGACLNTCPVYNSVGGHAYGWVYSGPIGAILAPQLLGTKVASDLPFASSLCGACGEICPVKIPIPQILLRLRHRVMEGDAVEPPVSPSSARAAASAGAAVLASPFLYGAAASMGNVAQAPLVRGGWIQSLPPPLNRWTDVRPFPTVQGGFRAWWQEHTPEPPDPALAASTEEATVSTEPVAENIDVQTTEIGVAAMTADEPKAPTSPDEVTPASPESSRRQKAVKAIVMVAVLVLITYAVREWRKRS
ncbi:MAG: LutB/LldF family L-lactate oxidation iron-sulfur protein [Anaerolineae bacterium]